MPPTSRPASMPLAELEAMLRDPFALEELGASTIPLVVATLPPALDRSQE